MALDVRASVYRFLEGKDDRTDRKAVATLIQELGNYPAPSTRRMVSIAGRNSPRTRGLLEDYLSVKGTPRGYDLPQTPTLSEVYKERKGGKEVTRQNVRAAESTASTLEIIVRFLVNAPHNKPYKPPHKGGTWHSTARKDPSTGENTHAGSWEDQTKLAPGQWPEARKFIEERMQGVPDGSLVNIWYGRKDATGETQWHTSGYIRVNGVFANADWQEQEEHWLDAEEGYSEESV